MIIATLAEAGRIVTALVAGFWQFEPPIVLARYGEVPQEFA
jgi:hypothetical protein